MDNVVKYSSNDVKKLEEYINSLKDYDRFDDVPKFEKNPFNCLLADVVEMKNVNKGIIKNIKSVKIVDSDTGEVNDASETRLFSTQQHVDNKFFTKIYLDRIKDLFSLNYAGLKVLGYIIMKLSSTKNNDTLISIREKEILEFCGWKSRSRIYAGLKELVFNGIICKADMPKQFFVNPVYMFKGNRIIVYNEYINKDYFKIKNE
ncbi:MAG: hypothetical protein QM235_12905 [Pseudomonadota bacterium]|nr:hypothetical protein [Pseudomonadota bacterium]